MGPRFTTNDTVNCGRVDTKHPTQSICSILGAALNVSTPNFDDLLIGKLAQVVRLTRTTYGPSILRALAHVVRVCSKMKVVWPNATAVSFIVNGVVLVARVAHLKSIWNRSEMKHPACSMSMDHSGLRSSEMNHAIPLGVKFGSPNPARFGLVNLRPKAIVDRFGKSHSGKNRVWIRRLFWPVSFPLARLRSICNRAHVLVLPRTDYESCAALSLCSPSITVQH